MRIIDTAIEIGAAPEQIWRILTATSQYPIWNPFITSIEGDLKVGTQVQVRIDPPGGKPMVFKPVIREVKSQAKLSWLGRVLAPGLFDGRHEFIITESSSTMITFIHREEFSGLLVPLLWNSMEQPTRSGFELMNTALKKRAEAVPVGVPSG